MKHLKTLTRSALTAAGLAALLSLAACSRPDTQASLISSGKEYVAKKDYKAAVVQFKSALQRDPTSLDARLLLGQSLLASGDAAGAMVELGKALDQKADENVVVPMLARAMLSAGEYRKLTAQFADRQLSDRAAQAALNVVLARGWANLSSPAKAEASLAAALNASPEFAPALLLKVQMLASKRDFDGALALVDAILARDASVMDAWLLKGDLLAFGKKDDVGARQAFRKVLDSDKANVMAYLSLISLELRNKNVPAAKAEADKLRTLLPNHGQVTFVDAQIAYAERNLPKARELAQQVLRLTSDHTGVLQLAGVVEAEIGSLVQAESLLAKALQLDPGLRAARQNLARVYLRLSQPKKALDTLQPLLADGTNDAESLALAGDAQQRLGNTAAAEASFVRAAKINPEDSRVLTALALSRLSRNDTSSAFAELETVAARSKDVIADRALVSARLRRNDFSGALAAIDAMEKKEPNSASVAELRGSVQLTRRDYASARSAYNQALQRDPALFSAVANLAAIDLLEKKPDAARERLERYIKADPRNAYALASLAELKVQTNAPLPEVRALLDSAIKAAPTEPLPRLQLMEILLRKRLYKDALIVAQEAAAAMPNDAVIMDSVGRAQMEAGDVEQAIGTFRKLASIEGNGARAYARLADIYKATGRRSQAESALRKALELEPGLTAAQITLIDLLIADKREKDALEFARRVQRDSSGSITGWVLEAMVHARLKAHPEAINALKAGLTKLPNNPDLTRELYRRLLFSGRTAEADRLAADWLKARPKDHVFEYMVAINRLARGDAAQAEVGLRNVLAQQPNHALTLNNLAGALIAQGKPGAAVFAQRAVDAVPDQPQLLDTLALSLAAEKQFDKALTVQRKALQLAPEDNSLRFHLAKIAFDAGDKALAKQELTRLKELGTKFALQAEVDKLLKAL